ncbi:MAG: polysaccharide deacetylase family protein [Candidatus Binatia bacterium]
MIGIHARRAQGKIEWPAGARLAVLISYDYHAGVGLEPGPKIRFNYRDASDCNYELYDGLRRVLDLHQRFEIPATFRIPGETVERNGEAVRQIHGAGHEIGGHGYSHEDVTALTKEQEKELIERTVAAVEKVTGKRPAGWRSGRSQPSDNTVDLLMELGFTWHSDFFDDDFPYLLESAQGQLLEIPYHWETGDLSLFSSPQLYPYGNPEDALGVWQDEFDFLYAESRSDPRMLVFSWQPFNIGRPSRVAALEKFFRYMKDHSGLWFARFDDVALWWMQQGY